MGSAATVGPPPFGPPREPLPGVATRPDFLPRGVGIGLAPGKDVATSKMTFASDLKKQMSNMSRHLPTNLEIPRDMSEMSRHVSTFAIVFW